MPSATARWRGRGKETNLARWDFWENPDRRDGVGLEQVWMLTLPVMGRVMGSVIVSARLAKPGLRGGLEAISDLMLGPTPDEGFYLNH